MRKRLGLYDEDEGGRRKTLEEEIKRWLPASAIVEIKKDEPWERSEDGGVRFQGEIPKPDGTLYLDRTTLSPLTGDRVRQVIEISRDDGRTWQVTFDAEYRRPKKP